MASGRQLSEPIERLLDRERDNALAALQRNHRRALDNNPDGCAIVAAALDQALRLGVEAQCDLDGLEPQALEGDARVWDEWQHAREEGSLSLGWPTHLGRSAPEVTDRARELLAAAAAELDLHPRDRRAIARAGEQCAEAGTALVRALTRPEPPDDAPPLMAEPAPVGPVEADGSVRVALAANQAECELIQGRLQTAGIPSMWRRAGGDLPYLQSGGYRDIYVPATAASEAQALLATVPVPPAADGGDRPTGRIGLERAGIRLLGKATAALMLLGLVTASISLFLSDSTVLAVVALAGLLVLIGAIVVWSERNSIR